MKANNLFFLIVFFIFGCNDKSLKKQILYYDNGNKKIERYLDDINMTQGKLYSYYPNEKLEMIVEYIDGRICGKFWSFYEDGMLQNTSKVFRGKKIDTAYYFSEIGLLKSKYIFGYGLNEDTIKKVEYYSNGKLKYEISGIQGNQLSPLFSNYIKYNRFGKIDYNTSNFVSIKYLTNNKIRLCVNRNKKYTLSMYRHKVDNTIYIRRILNEEYGFENDYIRKIHLPNSSKFDIKLNDNDYINNKINISIVETYLDELDKNRKGYFTYVYNIQLIKGDKSRWHNVHGIVKDDNTSLLK